MFGSTMMLTVGQAIDRAHHEERAVRLLVEGSWMAGRITATDAQSVMILDADGSTYVVRTDAITAVHLPVEGRIRGLPSQPAEGPDDRRPGSS